MRPNVGDAFMTNKTSGEAEPEPRPITALFAGENPVQSAPLLTLSNALKPYEIHPLFGEWREVDSLSGWLRLVRASDVIVYLDYDGPDPYMLRRLVLAAALGKPIVRWWVGTDVLQCATDPASGRQARRLARFCTESIAVAPHLQRELACIGIQAAMIPSVVDPDFMTLPEPVGPLPPGVLVYLPAARGPFYGEEIIERAILANPEVPFIVVADEQHRFRGHANVESLGWVRDMKPVYSRTGCLLRMTQHDGLPRMVIEALLLGKFVISSYAFPGCWLATGFEDIQKCIARFRGSRSVNVEGARAVREMLTPPPETQFAGVLRKSVGKPRAAARLGAIVAIAPLTVAAGLAWGMRRLRRKPSGG